jgi:hypothetical protein
LARLDPTAASADVLRLSSSGAAQAPAPLSSAPGGQARTGPSAVEQKRT